MTNWVVDPNGQGYYWGGSDAGNDKNWTKTPGGDPPAGYAPDPGWPGWYLLQGSDAADKNSWWYDGAATPSAGLVLAQGIDTASYQPSDLTALIQQWGVRHAAVRMYQRSVEGAALQAISRAQVASCVANSVTVSTPYYWQYASAPPDRQVNESLELAGECGITVKIHWVDIEKYTDGSIPSAQQVYDGLNVCAQLGVRGGIYTGYYIWRDLLQSATFAGVPLWFASYDHIPLFNVEPFGGMVLVAKQYDDKAPDGSSLDMDVFDASMI